MAKSDPDARVGTVRHAGYKGAWGARIDRMAAVFLTLSETTDEDPERVAVIQRLTWAYLASHLGTDDAAWDPRLAFDELAPLGRVETM